MAKSDSDVIIAALYKERQLAHEKVMQLDRIIKRIKDGNYEGEVLEVAAIEAPNRQPVVFNQSFKTADTKVQILKIMDSIGKAVKLQEIQDEYTRLTEMNYNIRDIVRSLQRANKVKMMREKSASRGFLWLKVEWLSDGQLLDQYKPEGFDLLYKPEDLIFE
jgi:hypothetical protein